MEPHDAQDHPQVRAYQRTSESGVPSRPRLAERAACPRAHVLLACLC